jgi:hypothetical protein
MSRDREAAPSCCGGERTIPVEVGEIIEQDGHADLKDDITAIEMDKEVNDERIAKMVSQYVRDRSKIEFADEVREVASFEVRVSELEKELAAKKVRIAELEEWIKR